MPSVEEFQNAINRWENEGGAIAENERSGPKTVTIKKQC
jgi:hypothetical protein